MNLPTPNCLVRGSTSKVPAAVEAHFKQPAQTVSSTNKPLQLSNWRKNGLVKFCDQRKVYSRGEWLDPLRRKVSQGVSRGGRSFQKLKTGYCRRFREISRCSLLFHCLTMSWPSMSSSHVRLPTKGGWKKIHHNQPQTNWPLKRLID